MGKLYFVSLPFLIWGLANAIRRRKKVDKFLLAWIGLAPIASSLTIDSPHSLRAIIMMPVLQIFTVQGLMSGYKLLGQKRFLLRTISVILITGLYLGGLSYFLWRYFLFYPEETAIYWLDGHKAVVEKIEKYRSQFDEIVFTTSRGQPHIFLAFFTPIDPETYQREAVGQQNIVNAYLTHLAGVQFKPLEGVDFCAKNALIIDETGMLRNIPKFDEVYFMNRFHEPKLAFEMFDTKDPKLRSFSCQ